MSNSRNLLLIEEDLDEETQIRRALRESQAKFNITTARSAHEAVELLYSPNPTDQLTPDLILVDLQQEAGSAVELLQLLKADPHTENVPVIVFLGAAAEDFADRCTEYGAARCLPKSVGWASLRKELVEAVGDTISLM